MRTLFLQAGDRFVHLGQRFEVRYVNQCRAHCVSVESREVAFTDLRTGQPRTFIAHSHDTLDVSPSAVVDRIGGAR